MQKNVLLLIEDFSTRVLTSACLRMENFEVLESESADKALHDIINKCGSVNLVILSTSKNDTDGLTSLKLLRSSTDLRFTPVLLLADEDQLDKQMDWKNAGANAWITKPFSQDQLMRAIKMVVF